MCVCKEALACERQKTASSTGDTFDLSSVLCWKETKEGLGGRKKNLEAIRGGVVHMSKNEINTV